MKRVTLYILLVPFVTAGLPADRLMDPNETETLIRRLTDNPRECWLTQGMIQARHMDYNEYDESIRETTETVYRDGARFRLETHLEDGLLTADSDQSRVQQQFQQDFKLNRDRIYVWDGLKYVQYYQSANYAVIETDTDQIPPVLCGPVTAGIIPWGCGDFTFLVISSQDPICRIMQQDNQDIILLTYQSNIISLETQISFVLDPARDYAVLSYSIENDQALLRQTYNDYLQVDNHWIPSKVLIERFDKRSGTPQLISYEDWQFENVDPTVPAEEMFSVTFKNGTMVELQADSELKTFLYNASDRVDITKILEDKIALLQAPDPDAVNCATAAIQHVAKRFSKNIQPSELAELVSEDTKKTALSDMKETLEEAGLTCMAIETDLETLEQIPDCTKVLYLTLSRHYVILEHIDADGIWVIDLTDRKFYAKRTIEEFMQEWSSGVALLVSNGPINPPLDADFRYLEPDETARIHGGGDFGKYSCTDKIQTNYHIRCPEPIGEFLCHGGYYIFYERYGCIEDENGGTCTGDRMPSYDLYHCLNDPYRQGNCWLSITKITRYVRACG